MPRKKEEAGDASDIDPSSSPAPVKMVGPMDDMGSHDIDKTKETKSKLGTDKGRLSGKTVKLTIHPGTGGDMSDVLIGHNYVLNQYKRNVEVEMPFEFYQVLKDAVVTTTVQSTGGVDSAVSIPQYSWTVSE